MDVRAGYKKTEVGVIPVDWVTAKLGDIGTIVRGASPRPAGDPRFFNGSFVPWLTVAALTTIPDHQLRVVEAASGLTEEGAKQSRALRPGTVIVANSGATLGVAKILGMSCCANDGVAAIVHQARGDAAFICYCINTMTRHLREVVATGNGQPNLNTHLIANILLPFPPEPEQRDIAKSLGDVDELIVGLDRLIAKKRDLKQAAMQQLLTGESRLRGFSSDWRKACFDDVLVRVNAKTHQLPAQRYQLVGACPVVDQGALTVSAFSDQVENRFRCPNGGVIVFGDHTCVVKFIDFDFLVGADGTQILRGKEGQVTRFHAYQLQHQRVESTGYNRHFKFLKQLTFVAPDAEEQAAIAAVLADMDTELAALEARRAKTQALKQGMMQALLTGQIRLQPSSDPAAGESAA